MVEVKVSLTLSNKVSLVKRVGMFRYDCNYNITSAATKVLLGIPVHIHIYCVFEWN